jgi:hypothetical protein
MKLLGVVEWTNRKGGNPIAGVRPLIEFQKTEWRKIDAMEEFPSEGLAFWPNAQGAAKGTLITFEPEPNSNEKYKFKIVDPKPEHEVLDLRSCGTVTDVHRLITSELLRLPRHIETSHVWLWCKPDVLVGPIELMRLANGMAKLNEPNLTRVKTYTGIQVRSIIVDQEERLLRVDRNASSSGYVDWDNDELILHRALQIAVRVAKQEGHDTGLTRKQLHAAAHALTLQGATSDAQLDLYRLNRALTLVENAEAVANQANELTKILHEHPVIKAELDKFRASVQADIAQSTRAEIERQLAIELSKLKEVTEEHTRMKYQLDVSEIELRKAEERLIALKNKAVIVASEAEAAVNARVLDAIDHPMELLAEVSVLRPLLGIEENRLFSTPNPKKSKSNANWVLSRGENINDKASLRRILTSAARARGVDPSLMMHIHAAIAAGLMPVTLGPRALSALAAYSHGTCGGRLLVIHVAPNVIKPSDLDEAPGGGIVAAVAATQDIDGIALVILEGANRSPLEASVLPLLQMTDAGLSTIESTGGLRLAATFVAGATTVPVTPQIWSYAVALYPEPSLATIQGETALGDLTLSSEFLALGEVPVGVVDSLIDAWPECLELRPTLERFGSALNRLYSGEERLTEALLNALILPYVATAMNAEEQADALSKVGDKDETIVTTLHRLRRRLC